MVRGCEPIPSRGLAVLCVLCFALLGGQASMAIRTLVAEPWNVPGASMESTLLHGDPFYSDKTVAAPLRRRVELARRSAPPRGCPPRPAR